MNHKETSHPAGQTVLRRCAPPPAGFFGHLSRLLGVLFGLALIATGGALLWAAWNDGGTGIGLGGLALAALGSGVAWLSCTAPSDQVCGAVRRVLEVITLQWW